MQAELAHTGRKMVTIIDPHLKAADDYPVYSEAKAKGLLVLRENQADGSAGGHFEVCMRMYAGVRGGSDTQPVDGRT